MDLLNSILNSMEAPPLNEEHKKQIKQQKELAERMKKKQKEEIIRFRKYVEERLERFSKDQRTHIEFQPFDKVHRAIIHETAEYCDLLAMSFGREDFDRYTVVYKKDNAPCEDEIIARRKGDGWNEEVAQEYAELRKQRELERLARLSAQSAEQIEKPVDVKPVTNYKDKYAHLIGQETAMEARRTETNQSYGFVPSKNKKDIRSIEQTLADIQAKKKRRLQQQQQEEENQNQEIVIVNDNNQTEPTNECDSIQN